MLVRSSLLSLDLWIYGRVHEVWEEKEYSFMNKPIRIQRSRQYKMVSLNGLPIVYVGRPTRWGNPYKDYELYSKQAAFELYDRWIFSIGENAPTFESIKKELRGKNLACWCPLDQKCHADILLEIAND